MMPWENVGSVDTGEMPDDENWILFCLGLAKNYVQFACGHPPDDSKQEIMWQEHELGDHPSIGVWYDMHEPTEYIATAEDALDAFNKHVSWTALKIFWKNQIAKDEEASDEEF